jgi:hypothetical protein
VRPTDGEDSEVSDLHVYLDALTATERRDLANALLRAAWSAVLPAMRILLLDLVAEADEAVLAEAGQ